ncbi:MAG TPA: hypothetical protein VKB78_14035 [Pirellulales bacterium]|nr:hypothetical protein [Pirellulales bacterium]
MTKPLFASIVFASALAGIARGDDSADAKAILDAAIKAAGGEAALAKPVAFYYKVKGTLYEGEKKTPTAGEWFIQGYDKERSISFDEDGKTAEIEVVNGKDGWIKEGDQPAERQTDDQIGLRRELVYLNWVTMLAPLKGKDFRLSMAGSAPVGDRKTVAITVEHDKHRPVTLYFDKDTNLLLKYERKFKNPDTGNDVVEDCLLSDYRDVQDTKQPFKAEVKWDGAPYVDLTITEMKLHEKPLDDKLFEKP